MPGWRFLKHQYDFLIRVAATKLAERAMYVFAALESIIVPFPVDPLLVATVLARPARWRQLANCRQRAGRASTVATSNGSTGKGTMIDSRAANTYIARSANLVAATRIRKSY